MVCAGLGLVGGGLVNPPPFVAEDDAGFFKTFFFLDGHKKKKYKEKQVVWAVSICFLFCFVSLVGNDGSQR
jgi:hypothetical protein